MFIQHYLIILHASTMSVESEHLADYIDMYQNQETADRSQFTSFERAASDLLILIAQEPLTQSRIDEAVRIDERAKKRVRGEKSSKKRQTTQQTLDCREYIQTHSTKIVKDVFGRNVEIKRVPSSGRPHSYHTFQSHELDSAMHLFREMNPYKNAVSFCKSLTFHLNQAGDTINFEEPFDGELHSLFDIATDETLMPTRSLVYHPPVAALGDDVAEQPSTIGDVTEARLSEAMKIRYPSTYTHVQISRKAQMYVNRIHNFFILLHVLHTYDMRLNKLSSSLRHWFNVPQKNVHRPTTLEYNAMVQIVKQHKEEAIVENELRKTEGVRKGYELYGMQRNLDHAHDDLVKQTQFSEACAEALAERETTIVGLQRTLNTERTLASTTINEQTATITELKSFLDHTNVAFRLKKLLDDTQLELHHLKSKFDEQSNTLQERNETILELTQWDGNMVCHAAPASPFDIPLWDTENIPLPLPPSDDAIGTIDAQRYVLLNLDSVDAMTIDDQPTPSWSLPRYHHRIRSASSLKMHSSIPPHVEEHSYMDSI